MEHQTLIHNTTTKQLADLFKETLKPELELLKNELLNKDANDDLLNTEQVCKLLDIDVSTLHRWRAKSKIKAYGISGARRYYKRSEIMEALKELK